MNIRATLSAARSFPCNRQHLEQVTGLSPVSCKRLIGQMRSELGMVIVYTRGVYVVEDWGVLDPAQIKR